MSGVQWRMFNRLEKEPGRGADLGGDAFFDHVSRRARNAALAGAEPGRPGAEPAGIFFCQPMELPANAR